MWRSQRAELSAIREIAEIYNNPFPHKDEQLELYFRRHDPYLQGADMKLNR